jgi:iron complex transport system substrate-binding protein
LAAVLVAWCLPALASVEVKDDAGQTVTLTAPARRIISLAPHVTELLFAAGAGQLVVGTPQYSDYPDAAKDIPRIGGSGGFDFERITALRPDLIVAWRSGNPAWVIERLHQIGFVLFLSEPRQLEDIASNMERLGVLTGNNAAAREASERFRHGYETLQARYSQRPPVTVFYQVWEQPLMTINGEHLISHVIQLCGGVNVFAELPALVPRINVEAVLRRRPEAILAAGDTDSRVLDSWRRWSQLEAVRKDHLFLVPFAQIARHGPRVLQGAQRVCAALEEVRTGR